MRKTESEVSDDHLGKTTTGGVRRSVALALAFDRNAHAPVWTDVANPKTFRASLLEPRDLTVSHTCSKWHTCEPSRPPMVTT
jgi:hypothetical protein